MALLVALHVLAAVVWVGGMFFAYMVLRHSLGPLEPAARIALWYRIFYRFLPWVWASVTLLLLSGYSMLFLHFGGFAGAGLPVDSCRARASPRCNQRAGTPIMASGFRQEARRMCMPFRRNQLIGARHREAVDVRFCCDQCCFERSGADDVDRLPISLRIMAAKPTTRPIS